MMNKFTSLLIGCSLALAGAALAQQPEETSTPKETQGKTHGAEAKPGANAVKPAATAAKEHGARTELPTSKVLKTEATPKSTPTETKATGKMSSGAVKSQSETNVSSEPTASATPHMGRKGLTSPVENAKVSPSVTPATAVGTAAPVKGARKTATPVTAAATATPAATASATPITAASASATATVAAAGQQNAQAPKGAAAKTPDPQQVQQIKVQHENFKAQPRPDKVPTVTFNANFRLQGSDRWQGPQYEVYRSYRPERHDRGWYKSRYNRVELIGGGYYYWNNGYWYPAWGYDNSAEYYAYDAPIYVGHRAEPPDRVIADVQAVLQNMGYYKGEVDGLLGPLTREALTGYQADRGLATTAVIDEPTLDSLGMG
jgi:putative peptidoglycan binding protein